MEESKIKEHLYRRILIAVFCVLVAVCVTFVMVRIYNPNKNALPALASVSMDVICIIILLIFTISFAFDNYRSNRTTRLFAILLVATIWAIFLDFLNWAFDGSLEFGHLTYWFTLGSLCMGAVLAGIFSLYICSYMEEMHRLSRMRLRADICAIVNLISFILTFVLAIAGVAFQFVDGHYETAALYDVVAVIPVLTLLYLTGFLIRHVKKIGIHDVVAVIGYIFFMIAGTLIESMYRIGTTYVAVSIADLFIFVMIQNEIIAQEKRNVLKWMAKSKTDELTGFFNRYAYEADIAKLEEGEIEDEFVYVSIDVNSLKSVNDSLGHNAGDELLVGASECLKAAFGPFGKLYRIGGDEFIALIYANDEQLAKSKNDIEELTKNWKGEQVQNLALSCGYITKKEQPEMTVRQMATLADRKMYEAKSEYYRRNGIERRRNR